jgi:hypothetical protein
MDGDKAGQERLKKVLEERLSGHRELRVRVIILPDNHDPDSYIRKHGIEAFRDLPAHKAFEWRLYQFSEGDDPSEIARQMVQFAVNEPSPVEREKLCRTLSQFTGISVKSIMEELYAILDAKAHERSLERQQLLERLTYELRKSPSNAEETLQKGLGGLLELNKRHDADLLSEDSFIAVIEDQKVSEEQKSGEHEGFRLGQDLKSMEESLCGDWTKDVFILIGGSPNAGKSSLMAKMACSIAQHNENVCCLFVSIDDTTERVVPRLVCILEKSLKLTMNQVRNPNYWQKQGVPMGVRRQDGYVKLKELVRQSKLVVKDINQGGTLPFLESLVSYYQDRYPSRQIVLFLDNFHKLQDVIRGSDERVRNKTLSQLTKALAEKLHIPIISSVEYTKMSPGTKPTNNNVAETNQILYDANYLVHLYSEVAEVPSSAIVCHHDIDYVGRQVMLPRIEAIVGKNKVSDWKGSFFIDFWPACSDFRYVSVEQVNKDRKMMKAKKLDVSSEDALDSEDF